KSSPSFGSGRSRVFDENELSRPQPRSLTAPELDPSLAAPTPAAPAPPAPPPLPERANAKHRSADPLSTPPAPQTSQPQRAPPPVPSVAKKKAVEDSLPPSEIAHLGTFPPVS